MKTILVSCSDDRYGRKDGKYEETQNKITNLFTHNPQFGIDIHLDMKWEDIAESDFYHKNKVLLNNTDAARNGRAYKPYAILNGLNLIEDNDFLIYTDCSPEMWKTFKEDIILSPIYNLNVIKELTVKNNNILNAFIKWDLKPLSKGQLGIHTHRHFTTDCCMNKMRLKFYEDSFMGASGMWCIRKTKETVDFIEEWLFYNCIDECCSLGKSEIPNDTSYWEKESHAVFGEVGYKMGHRHDQSISGLLLNRMNQKLVDIIYNDLNPYNFLQFCRTDSKYEFIDSNPIIPVGSIVINKQGTEMKVFRMENEQYVVGQNEQSCYATSRENIKLINK